MTEKTGNPHNYNNEVDEISDKQVPITGEVAIAVEPSSDSIENFSEYTDEYL